MLQQTRVAAVIEYYNQFLLRFPTLVALALAPESDVLAAWSGLGYYRRARMLHKAAQFILLEREGRLPTTSTELRTLPGIGEYTAAAIASIAFGESVAVVDGNVERVILRLTGRSHDDTVPDSSPKSAQSRAFVRAQAQALLPITLVQPASEPQKQAGRGRGPVVWDASERIAIAAAADPHAPAGTDEEPLPRLAHNPAGDHNQAMMELGATVCLPRAPLCLNCPVFALCLTRGEHAVPARPAQQSRPVAYLLDLRKRGTATEVLLERRASDASLMPAMYELPPLPLDAVEGREPVLRVRHAITNTNYYVQIFSPRHTEPDGSRARGRAEAHPLRRAVPAAARDLHWVRTTRLPAVPLTGLARKVLQRLKVMHTPRPAIFD
jgi:A/G-specific adenine glycosylase